MNGQFLRNLTVAKDLNAIALIVDQTGFHQSRRIDDCAVFKNVQVADVYKA